MRVSSKLCKYVETNVRPADWNVSDNCSGDCTTRALTFALEGEMSYKAIEAEQYRLAREHNANGEQRKRRNSIGIFDKILTSRGWKWLQLGKHMTRGELAVRIGWHTDATALAVSRAHIAAVKKGELIDCWDSRGGKCYAILVPSSAVDSVMTALGGDCTVVDTPTFVRVNKRRWVC